MPRASIHGWFSRYWCSWVVSFHYSGTDCFISHRNPRSQNIQNEFCSLTPHILACVFGFVFFIRPQGESAWPRVHGAFWLAKCTSKSTPDQRLQSSLFGCLQQGTQNIFRLIQVSLKCLHYHNMLLLTESGSWKGRFELVVKRRGEFVSFGLWNVTSQNNNGMDIGNDWHFRPMDTHDADMAVWHEGTAGTVSMLQFEYLAPFCITEVWVISLFRTSDTFISKMQAHHVSCSRS